MPLARNFFTSPAAVVAKTLLGKYIMRREYSKVWGGKVVEAEAYLGMEDKAAHSFGGKRTKRTEVMFCGGGFVYMFFVYGIHWQLNFTAGKKGSGQAVLVRALEPSLGLNLNRLPERVLPVDRLKLLRVASGPGKVAQYLELDDSFYGENLLESKRIWVEDRGIKVKKSEIISTTRVGVEYAGEWASAPLRFYIGSSKSVSKR